jgi:hypothetical protein
MGPVHGALLVPATPATRNVHPEQDLFDQHSQGAAQPHHAKDGAGAHCAPANPNTIMSSFALPATEIHKFGTLFKLLEKHRLRANIADLSIVSPSLEDVFLNILDSDAHNKHHQVYGVGSV